MERKAPGTARPGDIVDREGRVLGHHAGVHHFTVGQRKGLRLSSQAPLYVLAVDAPSAVSRWEPRGDSSGRVLTASGVNWIAGQAPPESGIRAGVQIRYRHPPASAIVMPLDAGRVRVEFDAPQPAITPGQATVFYDGDEVLGGGWIDTGLVGILVNRCLRQVGMLVSRCHRQVRDAASPSIWRRRLSRPRLNSFNATDRVSSD